jgi:hypothetical protein
MPAVTSLQGINMASYIKNGKLTRPFGSDFVLASYIAFPVLLVNITSWSINSGGIRRTGHHRLWMN